MHLSCIDELPSSERRTQLEAVQALETANPNNAVVADSDLVGARESTCRKSDDSTHPPAEERTRSD